jgi:very-short-patch-repair endonuclease
MEIEMENGKRQNDDDRENRAADEKNLSRREKKILHRKAEHRRRNATPAEKRLHGALRKRRVLDIHFRRQHVFKRLILNFYGREAGIAIQIRPDGLKWARPEEAEFLKRRGVTLLVFSETEVLERFEWVMQIIWGVCKDRIQSAAGDGQRAAGNQHQQSVSDGQDQTGARVIEVDFEKGVTQRSQRGTDARGAAASNQGASAERADRSSVGAYGSKSAPHTMSSSDPKPGRTIREWAEMITDIELLPLLATAGRVRLETIKARVATAPRRLRQMVAPTTDEDE